MFFYCKIMKKKKIKWKIWELNWRKSAKKGVNTHALQPLPLTSAQSDSELVVRSQWCSVEHDAKFEDNLKTFIKTLCFSPVQPLLLKIFGKYLTWSFPTYFSEKSDLAEVSWKLWKVKFWDLSSLEAVVIGL